MGLWNRFTQKATEVMFEGGQNSEPQVEFSAEQFSSCSVDGDVEQTAQNMLDEAVKELDQASPEDTIFKVEDCLSIFGEDCDSSIVLKMLETVAKKDPEVLIKDGKERILRINGIIQKVEADMHQTLETAKKAEQTIQQEIKKEEEEYSSDVEKLRMQCEADIKALRDKLAQDIQARSQIRDDHLEGLSSRQAENNSAKANAEALNREVVKLGSTQISRIERLLSKLNVEQSK